MATRVNDCPNPYLANNSTGWFGTGATRVTTAAGLDPVAGDTVGRTTAWQVAAGTSVIGPNLNGAGLAAERRNHTVWAKASAAGCSATLNLQSYNDTGATATFLAGHNGTATTLTAGQWVRVGHSATLHATANQCRTLISSTGTGTIQYSLALFEGAASLANVTTPPGPYFDGYSVGSAWNGTAGSSSSTQTLADAPQQVGTATVAASQSATVTAAAPTGVLAGDHQIVLAVCATTGEQIPTPPTGWLVAATSTMTSTLTGGDTTRAYLFVSDPAADPAGAAFSAAKINGSTGLAGTRMWTTARVAYRGGPGPADVAFATRTASSLTHSVPARTTAADHSVVVGGVILDQSGATNAFATTASPPAGWAELAELSTLATSGTIEALTVGVGAVEAVTAGSVSGSFTVGQADDAMVWALVLPSTTTAAPPDSAAVRYSWGAPDPISDEFDYVGPPDPVKWQNSPDAGMPGHNGNGRRIASSTTVGGGMMTIHGYPNGDTGWVRQRMDIQYGRWEVRSRSRNIGATGADYHFLHLIWPTSQSRKGDGEYDWLEYTAADQQSAEGWLHYPHPGTDVIQQVHVERLGVDMTDWHNVAFEWSADGLRGWIDGEPWYEASGGAITDIRRDLQTMPSGHLIHQVDNFTGSSGLRESVFEIEWSRFYPLTPATATAPTVSAGADAAHLVSTAFTRNASESANGATVTSRAWTIVSGPAGAGTTIGAAVALSWTPTVVGAYVLRYSATNSVGTSTDDVTVTVSTVPPDSSIRTRGFFAIL